MSKILSSLTDKFASMIGFVPTESIASTDVQSAIDEIDNKKLNVSDLKSSINASGDAPIYACRAWVNFNGVGTVAIRASGNVSSITDNGLGDYTINFTVPMPDANYAVVGTGSRNSGDSYADFIMVNATKIPTTSNVSILAKAGAGISEDQGYANVAIFR